jgi:hypothetical protein
MKVILRDGTDKTSNRFNMESEGKQKSKMTIRALAQIKFR